MPGLHNVYNALGTVATAFELTSPSRWYRRHFGTSAASRGGFQIKSEKRGIAVVVTTATTLQRSWRRSGLQTVGRENCGGFPTSTDYSERRLSSKNFCPLFNDAELLILTEIYAAGEDRKEGVEARAFYEGSESMALRCHFLENSGDCGPLLKTLPTGDMVITLGAGDIWQVSDELVKRLVNNKDPRDLGFKGPRE